MTIGDLGAVAIGTSTDPTATFDVYGNSHVSGALFVDGFIRVGFLDGAGSEMVCRNGGLRLSTCSSSLRYKTNIAAFSSGLSFIKQLRPISFKWKSIDLLDIGFGAEDVAKINRLFITYNSKGEVEGVKYDRLSVLFAIKEQQEQIKQQQALIERQQRQLDALTTLVCQTKPQEEICRQKETFR